MGEKTIQSEILELGRGPVRLFRTNAGVAWQCSGRPIFVEGGIFLPRGSKIALLPPGFPDIAGFRVVEITPDMIGKRVALFAAIEVKKPKKKRRENQEAFGRLFEWAGALYGVATSRKEARAILGIDDA